MPRNRFEMTSQPIIIVIVSDANAVPVADGETTVRCDARAVPVLVQGNVVSLLPLHAEGILYERVEHVVAHRGNGVLERLEVDRLPRNLRD